MGSKRERGREAQDKGSSLVCMKEVALRKGTFSSLASQKCFREIPLFYRREVEPEKQMAYPGF